MGGDAQNLADLS